MNEVRRAKNTILFIDELHTLVGAGGAEGAIDAAGQELLAAVRGGFDTVGTLYEGVKLRSAFCMAMRFH